VGSFSLGSARRPKGKDSSAIGLLAQSRTLLLIGLKLFSPKNQTKLIRYTLSVCLFQGNMGGLIVEGKKARNPRSFHRLDALIERKESLLFMGPTAKKLSVQIWKEREKWRCNLVK
jgi:hypothetical protein